MRTLNRALHATLSLGVLGITLSILWLHRDSSEHRAIVQKNELLVADIEEIEQDIVLLRKTIQEWHQDGFYREKMAREHLLMARPVDTILFVKKT